MNNSSNSFSKDNGFHGDYNSNSSSESCQFSADMIYNPQNDLLYREPIGYSALNNGKLFWEEHQQNESSPLAQGFAQYDVKNETVKFQNRDFPLNNMQQYLNRSVTNNSETKSDIIADDNSEVNTSCVNCDTNNESNHTNLQNNVYANYNNYYNEYGNFSDNTNDNTSINNYNANADVYASNNTDNANAYASNNTDNANAYDGNDIYNANAYNSNNTYNGNTYDSNYVCDNNTYANNTDNSNKTTNLEEPLKKIEPKKEAPVYVDVKKRNKENSAAYGVLGMAIIFLFFSIIAYAVFNHQSIVEWIVDTFSVYIN